MRLFQIHDAIEQLLNASVDAETGEINEAALAELDQLEESRDARALAVAAYSVGQDAEADAIDATAKRLRERARIHRAHAARLREYIAANVTPGAKLADDKVAISWRRSESVEITDEQQLPQALLRVTVEPDKVAIKAALKAAPVPGARLVSRQNVVIR